MNWTYFPKNKKIPPNLKQITDIFRESENLISSDTHELKSDDVLKVIKPKLEKIGYAVEKSKSKKDKVKIPVMYGENGISELSFEADAYNESEKIVVEVEAGRAVTNYQFLKDFYEACCMVDADYLCIAVRETYRRNQDYKRVCQFFTGMYISNRLDIPLKGILIIGY